MAADVSDNGEPVLIEKSDDERLVRRNQGVEEGGVESLIVAPIMEQESLVGVIEAVNKRDGAPFDDDDLFALSRLTESASIALHNASLLAAERKVEVLETLVTVSHEIASTLDLDRVLQAVVNGPATVIPYERAAIALEQRGRIQLRAVSGVKEFNPQDPQVAALSQILQWASLLREPALISQRYSGLACQHLDHFQVGHCQEVWVAAFERKHPHPAFFIGQGNASTKNGAEWWHKVCDSDPSFLRNRPPDRAFNKNCLTVT